MIAAHDKAIRTNRVDRDMASQLQTVLDEHHQSMVVHGYKEQSHLLESVGVALPKPLFDTKLAGYLVHPDFHADTLEQAAAHFLDLHIEEQSEGATQGTADSGIRSRTIVRSGTTTSFRVILRLLVC